MAASAKRRGRRVRPQASQDQDPGQHHGHVAGVPGLDVAHARTVRISTGTSDPEHRSRSAAGRGRTVLSSTRGPADEAASRQQRAGSPTQDRQPVRLMEFAQRGPEAVAVEESVERCKGRPSGEKVVLPAAQGRPRSAPGTTRSTAQIPRPSAARAASQDDARPKASDPDPTARRPRPGEEQQAMTPAPQPTGTAPTGCSRRGQRGQGKP